jgi:hypothetical protein
VLAAGLATMLMIGNWLRSGAPVETNHPNWQPVAAAKDASEKGAAVVVQRGSGGALRQEAAFKVSFGDADIALTHAVRHPLMKNDLDRAHAVLAGGFGTTPVKDQQPKVVANLGQFVRRQASWPRSLHQPEDLRTA